MIYLVSDTHFSHANIIKYGNRPFNNADEMDKALIDNWNSVVTPSDIVFFLGDFAFAGKERITQYRSMLNGDIYALRGNHDGSKKRFKDSGFKMLSNINTKHDFYYMDLREIDKSIKETILLTHVPYNEIKDYILEKFGVEFNCWNIHGHHHDIDKYPKIDYDNREINVSVEFWGYKPVPLSDILTIINLGYINFEDIK